MVEPPMVTQDAKVRSTGNRNRVAQTSLTVRGKRNLTAGRDIDNRRIHIEQLNITIQGAHTMSSSSERPEPFYRINEEQRDKLYTAKHLSRVIHDLAAGDSRSDSDLGVEISSRESFAVVMSLFEDLIDAGLSTDYVRPTT